ncbi:MAG: D-3-phosphoglycerate dehydrogenase / 2-oxoglutarate reductase [Gaiellales bacterium]|nr:D-3-phosphoglycerate dehydrogenase / 2-oxoglutarate reductase [Gaiellales bacterium]
MTTAARRIVVTTEGARGAAGGLAELVAAGAEIIPRYDLGDGHDGAALGDGLAGAWAVVAGSERYTADVFAAASSLRALVRFGAGYDAVDVAAATRAGVAVCITPGANAEAVADMALALMLACLRRIPELDASVRGGTWRPPGVARDLAGATVAIVGLGAIGRAVARRLRGFGCSLLAVEPHPGDGMAELGVELCDLDGALRRADVVTLHAPAVDLSHPLLGRREIGLLQAHAIVVNTARGGLVDEPALVEALREGRIGGAGLDVFAREPLAAGDPLTTLPNVVLSGHASAFTPSAIERTGAAVVAALAGLLAGELPAACLNPAAWTD